MANAIRGEVPLNLSDGRNLVLVMDMEALVEAEAAYGKPMAGMMADAGAGFVGASRALLYGSLRTKHPETTLRDASAIMASDGEAAAKALSAAVEVGFPKASPGGNDLAQPQAGKTSGGSGAKRGSSRTTSGA